MRVEHGMKAVYLAHPLGAATPDGVEANKARARRWIRWIYDHFPNVAVVADWLITCDVLDDFRPEHRAHGMKMNRVIIPLCREFWMVGGRISSGMNSEQYTADEHGLRIVDLTFLGEEPPHEVPEAVLRLVA